MRVMPRLVVDLIGASIGHYMDNQEAKLKTVSSKYRRFSVKREGDQIRLIMPGNITFANRSL